GLLWRGFPTRRRSHEPPVRQTRDASSLSSTCDCGATHQSIVPTRRSPSATRRTYQGSAAMKLGVSATLLLAFLAGAPVAFAQEPAPRTSTDLPATLDSVSTSLDSATSSSPADAPAIETPAAAATPPLN